MGDRASADSLRWNLDLVLDQRGADIADLPGGASGFQDRGNAERYLALMQSQYGSGRITVREGDPTLWRVLVGSEKTLERAIALASRIRQESAERTAFVARLDR